MLADDHQVLGGSPVADDLLGLSDLLQHFLVVAFLEQKPLDLVELVQGLVQLIELFQLVLPLLSLDSILIYGAFFAAAQLVDPLNANVEVVLGIIQSHLLQNRVV